MSILKSEFKNDKLVRVYTEGYNFNTQYDVNNTVVFHHDDADGKLGGHLIYENLRLENTKKFMCCNYSTNVPKESAVNEGDLVFIVDYCIPMDQLVPIVNKAKLVVFLDHRQTALNMVDKNYDYFVKLTEQNKIIIDLTLGPRLGVNFYTIKITLKEL